MYAKNAKKIVATSMCPRVYDCLSVCTFDGNCVWKMQVIAMNASVEVRYRRRYVNMSTEVAGACPIVPSPALPAGE